MEVYNSDDSHKKALFVGGTISHAATRELETQNMLYNAEKLLSKVDASLTAHKALTLADVSLEKLLKSVSCQELLCGNVSGNYSHFANLPL
jgi:hypothetical protein